MTATLSAPKGTQGSQLPPRPGRPWWFLLLDGLGSMKLTVVLLLFFFVLTWAGTLAQGEHGLFIVQRDFFESFLVPPQLLDGLPVYGWLHQVGLGRLCILPGGYLLMVSLFVNMAIGGIARVRWHARNFGVLVAHLGIGLLLVAGFVKLHWSVSGRVTLWEGNEATTMVSFHDFELALIRQDGTNIVERTVPESALHAARTGPLTIDDPKLPFTVTLTHWFDNCRARQKGPMFDVDVPVITDSSGVGVFLQKEEVDSERSRNTAGCYATVTERNGGAKHDGVLVGFTWLATNGGQRPFTFVVGSTTWGLELRRQTWDLPFKVRLDKFQKTDHPGTMQPKDFSSWVTVFEADRQLPTHIYMNHPLRRDGYVFFQTDWGPKPGENMQGPPWHSTFEVAQNPSDKWPEYASYVILLGLLLHFVPKLGRHLRSSNYKSQLPEMS